MVNHTANCSASHPPLPVQVPNVVGNVPPNRHRPIKASLANVNLPSRVHISLVRANSLIPGYAHTFHHHPACCILVFGTAPTFQHSCSQRCRRAGRLAHRTQRFALKLNPLHRPLLSGYQLAKHKGHLLQTSHQRQMAPYYSIRVYHARSVFFPPANAHSTITQPKLQLKARKPSS